MNGGNCRANRLATSDQSDPDRPGIDSGRCRFIEVPEFISLVKLRMQLFDSPRPLNIMGFQPIRQPGLGDLVTFHRVPLNSLSTASYS